jgi:hypothetical protein
MALSTSLLIYLLSYRLAIIAAGIISIVLGYLLFCRGVWPKEGKGSDVDAKIGASRLTLKNAAPGTCFAFFGAILISIMVATGKPEAVKETLIEINGADSLGAKNVTTVKMKDVLRAVDQDLVITVLNEYKDGIINQQQAYQSLCESLAKNAKK